MADAPENRRAADRDGSRTACAAARRDHVGVALQHADAFDRDVEVLRTSCA